MASSKKKTKKTVAVKAKAKTKRVTTKVKAKSKVPARAVKSNPKAVAPKKPSASPKVSPKSSPQNKWQNLFTPLADRVLIEKTPESERTTGGLIIPGSASERPNKGRVLCVGRGVINKKGKLRRTDVSAGDEVLFSPHSGTEIKVGGVEVLLVSENEILGIVK